MDHGAAGAEGPTLRQWAQGARILGGLGAYHRPAGTPSAEAQAYFDQGLRLIYAFNHDEATRSFAKAAEIDPTCAMCYWGATEALGPNYNVPMLPDRWRAAWEAFGLAQRYSTKAAPADRALIAALAKRMNGPEPLEPAAMQPFLVAYADAMRGVAERFPDDDDVQAFFAESLMTANPWKLWRPDGTAAPGTDEIVATLRRVLAHNPGHPGANHDLIHALEASPKPERALAAAERLGPMMPGAGHLVHMPSHIFQRVGRYEDAAAANRAAVTADRAYIAVAHPPAYSYYGMYLAHNYQFLAYSAAMEGRAEEAIAAARQVSKALPPDMLMTMPGADYYVSEIYPVLIRFGRWDAILAEPAPPPGHKNLTGQYHFARALAFAARGRVAQAEAEKQAIDALAAEVPADLLAGLNSSRDILAIASLAAGGRIAAARGDMKTAAARLREAVAREDKLNYDEPRTWFVPNRHLLGAVLLAAHRDAEAETVYRADLKQNPENGWALYGLGAALGAQGKAADAAAAEARFRTAWSRADTPIGASAF
jgi:tetratricopeptide (TPR) repeat protein